MHATGTLYLSRTRPEVGTVDGAFALTLLLMDNIGPRRVPYRVRWTGAAAQAFWQQHGPHLQPGAVLTVELERLQDHVADTRPPTSELRARVIRLEYHPKRTPAAPGQHASTQPTQPAAAAA